MVSGYLRIRVMLLGVVSCVYWVLTARSATLPSEGKALYGPCVVCHQPNAWGSPDGNIPSLAGQQSSYLESQLAMFRSGTRVGTAMQLVSAHPTFNNHQSIVELSDYLASLDPNPNPVKGPGGHRRIGQEIYSHLCASCHGIHGSGDARSRVPGFLGQHYPYVRRQIEEVASLHREFVPRDMVVVLGNLYGDQKDAVADYISRLNESADVLDSNR